MVGMLVKDILFKTGEAAFVFCGTIGGGPSFGQRVSALLAIADGGHASRKLREEIVGFVSLMRYLEENKLVYFMAHDSSFPSALFYQPSDTFTINWHQESSRRSGEYYTNVNKDSIADNVVLRVEDRTRSGYIEEITCKGITLADGNMLVEIGISHQLKEELLRYLTSHAYPTIALADLVENDFQSPEEQVAKRSLSLAAAQVDKAQKTLVVAIITLLVALFTPVFKAYAGEKVILLLIVVTIFFTLGWMMYDGNADDSADKY